MHQHPRSPAVPSSAPSFPSRPTTRDDVGDQDSTPSSPTVDMGSNSARGLGIEPGSQPEQARNAAPAKEALARLNQIISNYHTKAALIILHSRVALPPSFTKGSESPRVNRWFNVEIEDTDILREPLRLWRTCDATENRPPPLVIETYLDTKGLTNNQSLVILDENGKRWDVRESLTALRGHAKPYQSDSDDIILERWKIELGGSTSRPPADLGSILPTVYKKSIVLFRSLFTYSKFLPAWRFSKRNKKSRRSPALEIKYRVVDAGAHRDAPIDHLTAPLSEGSEKVVDTYSFGVTESPAGPFSIQVTYRTNCDFRVDDSEALLSSRFMGADDEIFRPSLPSEDINRLNPEVGSVPVGRRTVENPDCTRAYGSLSTFHQVGPATGASPISALRALRDSGATSPSPTETPKKLLPPAKVVPTGRAAQIAGESGPSSFPRRPSVSFQPFKAPPLSASPALADSPLGVSPRNMSSRMQTGTSADSRFMPPPSSAASARRPLSIPSEQAISSSNSASPKPAPPISRYSSSFSHRRGRLSAGANRLDDEQSSGRASATSSNAQPGSGLLAEATGTSAESIHADDENISDFLKMLDSKKDLLRSSTSASIQSGTQRLSSTQLALNRFRAMRDSNDVLSDSMDIGLRSLQASSSPGFRLWSRAPQSPQHPPQESPSLRTLLTPPHTPAIRSRLSSNSVADDIETDHRRIPRIEHDSPLEEHPSIEGNQGPSSTAGAIDIPTSPRVFSPAYRRSSSAAQRRAPVTGDDDDIFPFGLRSLSLGADDRPAVSPEAIQPQNEYASSDTTTYDAQKGQQSSIESPTVPSASTAGRYRDGASLRGQMSGPTGASASSNPHLYQPRFASFRGRGNSGGHSLSSASSSLARGANIPPHLVERDQDRDGNASGSNSGNSTMEIRRGSMQRPGTGRTFSAQAPEDDEPLLFAMSDFGASRRSLEENRGNHGGADSAGGSRRGSGRRGAGLPNFHIW
ncbi:uncharacterized protein N7446_007202 [Penicillium canescens]|uniref:uncharacterized protein n=1 Tax=Penicillium canescens TaxID=5083 RepID=UPI0026E0D510|nr:uncharacterized protein N7446_007202 [Penicillium canescens]KAJ6063082.1 hypothetical protein N7446_007202 [Penicillium canescens]